MNEKKSSEIEEEFLTTPELMEKFKVAKSTLSKWRKEGLPCVGKTRAYRYKFSEVLKWLEEREKARKLKEMDK